MDSWWDFGEWSGFHGKKLALYKITCPFCQERGNFSGEHHAEKKKPNSEKTLNFDTLKCGNCANFIMVFWSAAAGYGSDIHNYRVLPWPLRVDDYPEHWPSDVGRYWLQAKRNLQGENWDAAALMARSALQLALRAQDAKGNNLNQEIDDLASKGILPPIIHEWSNEVRELGNDSAHPKPGQAPTEARDAQDIVRFLDFLLEYLYSLPHRIKEYRKRRSGDAGG